MEQKLRTPQRSFTAWAGLGLAAVATVSWLVVAAPANAQSRSAVSRSSGSSSSSGSSASSSPSRGAVSRSSGPSVSSRSTGSSARSSRSGAARTRPSFDNYSSQRRRSRGSFRHRHSGHYYGLYGYYSPFYWHPFWGYYGYRHYGPRYGYYPDYGSYGHGARYAMGALDLNVEPRRTEVYIDGQYVGTAKRYDGFPGYLWLEKGTYEVAFYRPGFATEVREFTVYPGLVLDVDVEMAPGEGERPVRKKLVPSSPDEYRYPDRDPRHLMPARVVIDVEPADASVYLDGRFLGTGEQLARLHKGLSVEAGDHVLEVSRPGFETQSIPFSAEAAEQLELEVELDPSGAVEPLK